MIIAIQSNGRALRRVAVACLLAMAALPTGQAVNAQAAPGKEIGREDFFVEGIAPVRKSPGYDVTIVYFMDYQCPACRKFTPDVARAFKEDRKLRVIYRDTPIFGPRSEAAARAAIASQFQGRHDAMHMALMLTKGPLDDAAIRAAADKAGVDWARLQRDLDARGDEIDRLIDWNQRLSRAAGVSGTPAFVVGTTLADGALDYRGMKTEIAEARGEAAPAAGARPDRQTDAGAQAAKAGEEQTPEASGPDQTDAAGDEAPMTETPADVATVAGEPAGTAPFVREQTAIGSDAAAADDDDRLGERRPTWGLVAGFVILLLIGFISFRRSRNRGA